ncbi:TPA: cardiolipin synthase, partial [Bacillus anthracis]|nr:cardiolipin synthase [Bacillus anthracis]
LSILEQKVKEGVEVRVLYDGMIEFSTLSFDYTQRLKKIGIQAKAFSPISPFISTYYNYRDHRKIIVIDGKVGFTGGVNLADEYINKLE